MVSLVGWLAGWLAGRPVGRPALHSVKELTQGSLTESD